jgi:hypothetical protein
MLNDFIKYLQCLSLMYYAIIFLIVVPAVAITAIVLNIQTNSFDGAINWIAYLIVYLLIICLIIIWIKNNQYKFK